MPDSFTRFESGSLWRLAVERARSALSRGALQPIVTERRTIEDRGIRFEIRIVSSLRQKRADGQGRWPTAPRSANPFLPYEKELFVADVSETHLCLLNKYNVIDHHLLIVTRDFEPQENSLTPADFEALSICMAEFDALGFYNSGPVAGASQPHKHLQLVPLPLFAGTADIAVSVLFDPSTPANEPLRIAGLPFTHAFAWIDTPESATTAERADRMLGLYRKLLAAGGVDPMDPQPGPYNLLVTRRFMLVVPRRLERYANVAVNALGYAGSFFVADSTGLEVIHNTGPLELLTQAGFAHPAPK